MPEDLPKIAHQRIDIPISGERMAGTLYLEAAVIPDGAHRFYSNLSCPKREMWLDELTEFDFYDRDEPVKIASDLAAEHFRTALSSPDTRQ